MYQRIWTPHVYVGEKPTTVREPGNEHDRSASSPVMQSKYAMVDFHPKLPHFIQTSTLTARFPQYRKRSILWELSLQYSFSPVFGIFLHLSPCYRIAFLSIFKLCIIFLLLCRSLWCLNFYSCITSHK